MFKTEALFSARRRLMCELQYDHKFKNELNSKN